MEPEKRPFVGDKVSPANLAPIPTEMESVHVPGVQTKLVANNNFNNHASSGHTSKPEATAVAVPKDVEVALMEAKNEYLDNKKDTDDDRETWGKKADFLLSIIGFAVDLANVWRFPYLCYKNGGGAFLIPYFSMLICGAVPLFYMELCLGQFHRSGAITVWKITPLFKGIGIAECLIAYYVAFYYNVIIAWSLYYFIASFKKTLPWTSCNNDFNSHSCYDGGNKTKLVNDSYIARNISSATEYFERGVLSLHNSTGIDDLGMPRWQLVLCLMAVFTILYFSLWKGVKTSGKVVWFTATMPYVVLTILLIRGFFLPGSGAGILYFITPRLDRLGDPQVWTDAAIQIFYSVGAGFGTHLAYASYNKFNNNCHRDCIATAFVNSFTSIFSGFVIFSYLGYMAKMQNKDISDVADEGPGLVFVVYPEAIATLPGSVGWAIIFFLMLLTLGLDSAMGGLEAVITGIMDEFKPFFKRWRFSREVFTAAVVASAFLLAIPNVTNGGVYLLTMWDTFAGAPLLFVVLTQSIAVSWFYGLGPFSHDIERMLGFKPHLYWKITWKFISPLFLLVIVVTSFVNFAPLKYESSLGPYIYPGWANSIGWCIVASSMLIVPLTAVYQILKAPGSFKQRIALSISPVWEHRSIMQGKEVSRFKVHVNSY